MSLDIACRDVICALSSAQGPGAIAVVRASGPSALTILTKVFFRKHGELRPSVSMYGELCNQTGTVIDEVMAVYFEQGRSFTGEESFEIYCHGNYIIIEQILQILCQEGARLAEPGEFSMRAVLHGKLDLAAAESIMDLIHAKSEAAKDVALKGLQGGLLGKTKGLRDTIVRSLAEMEARMDFPEEDLGSLDRLGLLAKLAACTTSLAEILRTADMGLRLREGARLVICGAPNAGKSTLLNRLCGEERAIVHEQAGTTRDVIECNVVLQGIPVTVVDVAGIRSLEAACDIERIGIDRALQEIAKAHAIIWLADAAKPEPFHDHLIEAALAAAKARVFRVLNKVECSTSTADCDARISAKTGFGMEEFTALIYKNLAHGTIDTSEIFITRARQKRELEYAYEALVESALALEHGLIDEVVTSELRGAGLAFDRLFGTDVSEDVLNTIFAEFCIGK